MEPLVALKDAATRLLELRGAERAALLLAEAELLVAGPAERWSMGQRVVQAHAVVVMVDPEPFVELERDAQLRGQLRDALASAMQSDRTELKELSVCVRLPGVSRPWREVYRTAPRVAVPRMPEPDAVLAAATALLEAAGADDEARLLCRCSLELGEIVSDRSRLLLRCVLRLPPAELVALQRSRARQAIIERAVANAVAGPLVAAGEVQFVAAAPMR